MTFEEWQGKHGPNGGAYDIEMQRAGWDGRKQQVEDLSALAARLVRALRKAAPEHNLPALAMDYLQREGLCGSPLRDAPNAGGNATERSEGRVDHNVGRLTPGEE
jgi:hypothetical protein